MCNLVTYPFSTTPNLLQITGVTLGSSLPAGWTLTNNFGVPGSLQISLAGTNPILAGPATLAQIQGEVHGVPRMDRQILSISSVQLNGGTIPATGEIAIEVTALLGDVDGNGSYSTNDSSMVLSYYIQKFSGFAAFPLVDPVIIGDILGHGKIDPADALGVLEEALGRSRPE